jgi:hypothetical protein
MSRWIFAVALGAALAGIAMASPARAEAETEKTPSEMALEGLSRLMDALNLFIDSIPQYEPPYIDENGDIIIRRKRDHGPQERQSDKPLPGDTDSTRI